MVAARPFSGFPANFKYTSDHEWIESSENAKAGISDFAQEELGDIVYVDLPEVGTEFEKGEAYAAVESVKSSNDIYAPASGVITAVNEALEDEPELLNASAHGDGWIAEFKLNDLSELDELMDSEAYASHVEDSAH